MSTSKKSPEPTKKKSKWLRKTFVVLLILFLAAQLYPVNRHNPEVVADILAPDDVKAILKRACYDCHSNETNWLWYSYVSPFSILVERDVREGRNAVNFSEWGDYYEQEETGEMFLDECWDSIEDGGMPLWFYLPLHPEAVLTDEDIKILKAWCGADAIEAADVTEGSEQASEKEKEE